jgi:hypothetical protein
MLIGRLKFTALPVVNAELLIEGIESLFFEFIKKTYFRGLKISYYGFK